MTVAKIGKWIRIRITLTITKVSKIKLSFLYQKYQQLPIGRFMGSVRGRSTTTWSKFYPILTPYPNLVEKIALYQLYPLTLHPLLLSELLNDPYILITFFFPPGKQVMNTEGTN